MSHQPYDPYYLAVAPPVPDYGASFAGGEKGLINTLFVSGLPDDVKAREIHNLFRRRPGFDSCQLKYTGRGNQVVAFATFFNHQSAIAALHALNGVKFDPQTGSTLHIEIARSNSRRKRKPGSGPYVVIDNRSNEASNAQEPSSNDDGDSESEDPSDEDNHGSGNEDDSETAKRLEALKHRMVRQQVLMALQKRRIRRSLWMGMSTHVQLCLLRTWVQIAQRKNWHRLSPNMLDSRWLNYVAEAECQSHLLILRKLSKLARPWRSFRVAS